MQVKLVSHTKVAESYINELIKHVSNDTEENAVADLVKPEGLTAYCARVSSNNQLNPSYAKLLKYCIDHGHWSVFEMIDVTFEIETSRAIAAQILRHRSFCFQEFSQRYQALTADDYELYAARAQDNKNRQNSLDTIASDLKDEWLSRQNILWQASYESYKWALDNGIAKECARMVLPLQTKTRLYMKGSLRSWIHYLQVRDNSATQLEHREIASKIRELLKENFPTIAEACSW